MIAIDSMMRPIPIPNSVETDEEKADWGGRIRAHAFKNK